MDSKRKAIIAILIIIVGVISLGIVSYYFVIDEVNDKIGGVSNFTVGNISFNHSNEFSQRTSEIMDYNWCSVQFDCYGAGGPVIYVGIDEPENLEKYSPYSNDSNWFYYKNILKINKTLVDNHNAYDVTSVESLSSGTYYQRDLIIESEQYVYIFNFRYFDSLDRLNSHVDIVKNSIRFNE